MKCSLSLCLLISFASSLCPKSVYARRRLGAPQCPTEFHYQDYPSGRCIPNDPRIWRKERTTYIPYTNKYVCKPGYLNLGIDQCWIKIDDIEAAAFDTAEDSCPTEFHYQDYPSGRCIPNDPRIWRKERTTYIPYTNKYVCKPGYLNLGIDQCWIKIDDIEAAAFDTAEDSCPTDFHYQDYPSGRCIPNDPRIWRKERTTYIPYRNKYVCKPGYLNLGIDQCWIKIDDVEAAFNLVF